MTYETLLKKLLLLSKDQLKCDVAIHDLVEDEVYGSDSGIELEVADSNNCVLDEGHPVILLRR